MSLKATWSVAVQSSTKKFADAYQAWYDDLYAKSQGGNEKAKNDFTIQQIKKSGFISGPKFTNYCKFKSDFGPSLDKLEAMVKANGDADKKVATLTLAEILKNPKALGTFKHYCEGGGHLGEVYAFVAGGGAKMKPQAIYDTFLKKGAKHLLNEDAEVLELWQGMHASKNWKAAPASIKDILTRQTQYLANGLAKCVKVPTYAKFLRANCGGADPAQIEKAADKCRALAFENVKEVQGYAKRWSPISQIKKHDFWTPLLKALESIIQGVNTLEKA